jgi:hypothetical protein
MSGRRAPRVKIQQKDDEKKPGHVLLRHTIGTKYNLDKNCINVVFDVSTCKEPSFLGEQQRIEQVQSPRDISRLFQQRGCVLLCQKITSIACRPGCDSFHVNHLPDEILTLLESHLEHHATVINKDTNDGIVLRNFRTWRTAEFQKKVCKDVVARPAGAAAAAAPLLVGSIVPAPEHELPDGFKIERFVAEGTKTLPERFWVFFGVPERRLLRHGNFCIIPRDETIPPVSPICVHAVTTTCQKSDCPYVHPEGEVKTTAVELYKNYNKVEAQAKESRKKQEIAEIVHGIVAPNFEYLGNSFEAARQQIILTKCMASHALLKAADAQKTSTEALEKAEFASIESQTAIVESKTAITNSERGNEGMLKHLEEYSKQISAIREDNQLWLQNSMQAVDQYLAAKVDMQGQQLCSALEKQKASLLHEGRVLGAKVDRVEGRVARLETMAESVMTIAKFRRILDAPLPAMSRSLFDNIPPPSKQSSLQLPTFYTPRIVSESSVPNLAKNDSASTPVTWNSNNLHLRK